MSQSSDTQVAAESDRHNRALSERRAQSVLKFLQLAVRTLITANSTLFRTKVFKGQGEIWADVMGIPDGDEREFYRAVTVKAWPNPNPPPIKKPKPPAEVIPRVTRRRWYSVNQLTGAADMAFRDSGAHGVALAELAKNIFAANDRGGTDAREYANFPVEFRVNKVVDKWVLDQSRVTGVVKTVTYETDIRYEWGPPRDWVLLERIRTTLYTGNKRRTKKSSNLYQRRKIWGKVTSPTASVVG